MIQLIPYQKVLLLIYKFNVYVLIGGVITFSSYTKPNIEKNLIHQLIKWNFKNTNSISENYIIQIIFTEDI